MNKKAIYRIEQFGKLIDLRIDEKVGMDETRNLRQLDYLHVRRYWVKQCCHSTDESLSERVRIKWAKMWNFEFPKWVKTFCLYWGYGNESMHLIFEVFTSTCVAYDRLC